MNLSNFCNFTDMRESILMVEKNEIDKAIIKYSLFYSVKNKRVIKA